MRIYVASDHYLHEWDERYHALVAKNLIKHPLKPTLYDNTFIKYDYRVWVKNNVWLEKPPVPLWFIALSIDTFGNSDFAVRIPTLIFSLLAIYLTFLLGKYLFNERVGLLAAFLHAINGLVLEIGSGRLSSDHVETFFNIFIEIAILFCIISIIQKNKYYLSFLGGLFIGLAILSKWLPALIVFPVWLTGAIFARKYTVREIIRHFIIIVIGCLIIALPWFIYIMLTFPLEAKWVIRKFLFAYSTSIENHNAPWWYYINYVEIIFGELVYIPLIFAMYILFKDKKEWALKLLSIWWIIPVVIFSFAETKRHTYLMLSSPSYFLITAWFWYYLKEAYVKKQYLWLKYVVLWLLILLPIRLNIERINPFEREDKDPSWAQELRNLNQRLPEKKVVIFNSERPIETMFYTNFTAYSGNPDSATLSTFISNGYTPYIYKSGVLSKLISPYKN
ncbi:MAG: glycosyltransferase family 39 protein [Bacteroidales bacterium]|nr:glycosyltransferase family 39 protein [Bacteroidales bacterium]